MIRVLYSLAALTIFASAAVAGDLSSYKITFRTLSCDGSEGFASVDADKIVKIESSKCREDDPIPETYQLLVNSEPGTSYAYLVFTTSKKEAGRIMKRVDQHQEDKAKSLRESSRLILVK